MSEGPRPTSRRALFERLRGRAAPTGHWIKLHRSAMACRFEVTLASEDARHVEDARLALDAIFQDNVKARRLQADGSYKRRRPAKGEEAYRSQFELHREAKRAADRLRASTGVTLEPIRSPAE